MGGFAWVTLATNDSYSLGALVLAHSLKKANTAHKLVVLITPSVSQPMREQLQTVFDIVKLVEVLDSKDEAHLALLKRPELGITFTKIHCWRLTEFDKCVFLDADTLVVRNCDELFEREELSAAPDFSWPDCFNSGVFVFKPSVETFDKILQFAVEKGSFDGGDQGLLNMFFSDWATQDIKKHLPFTYNLSSLAAYTYIPAFKQYGAETRIVHFIGTGKPWLQKLDPATKIISPTPGAEHLTPMLQRWWDLFCEHVHPHLNKNLDNSNGRPQPEPVEVCSNSVINEINDDFLKPCNPEPYAPYREKDDYRQFNLPYQPFDVKGTSGELLNIEFLKASAAPSPPPPEIEERKEEEIEQNSEQMEEKKVEEVEEKEEKQETETKEEEPGEEEKEAEEKQIIEEAPAPKGPFDYDTFFPDENCINNYLEQNVMTYQPFGHHSHHHKNDHQHQSHHHQQESQNQEQNYQPHQETHNHHHEAHHQETHSHQHNQHNEHSHKPEEHCNNQNHENQEHQNWQPPRNDFHHDQNNKYDSQHVVHLPRFLTIPENDMRQSGNTISENSAHEKPKSDHSNVIKEPSPPFEEFRRTPPLPPPSHLEDKPPEKPELKKSKSMPQLDVTKIGSTLKPSSVWQSQPNVSTDPKKYLMPKLKPILPKSNSFHKTVPSTFARVTLYTEFLMSSDYKEPLGLPKDKTDFVEMQIRKEAHLKRSKSEGNLGNKFGPLPYVEEGKKLATPKKRPFHSLDHSDLIDIRECKRQLGNKPKPKEEEKKEEEIQPAAPKQTEVKKIGLFKRMKSRESMLLERRKKKLGKETKKSKENRIPRQELNGQTSSSLKKTNEHTEIFKPPVNGISNNVEDILNKLKNFSKDYIHYFGDIRKKDKPVQKEQNVEKSSLDNNENKVESRLVETSTLEEEPKLNHVNGVGSYINKENKTRAKLKEKVSESKSMPDSKKIEQNDVEEKEETKELRESINELQLENMNKSNKNMGADIQQNRSELKEVGTNKTTLQQTIEKIDGKENGSEDIDTKIKLGTSNTIEKLDDGVKVREDKERSKESEKLENSFCGRNGNVCDNTSETERVDVTTVNSSETEKVIESLLSPSLSREKPENGSVEKALEKTQENLVEEVEIEGKEKEESEDLKDSLNKSEQSETAEKLNDNLVNGNIDESAVKSSETVKVVENINSCEGNSNRSLSISEKSENAGVTDSLEEILDNLVKEVETESEIEKKKEESEDLNGSLNTSEEPRVLENNSENADESSVKRSETEKVVESINSSEESTSQSLSETLEKTQDNLEGEVETEVEVEKKKEESEGLVDSLNGSKQSEVSEKPIENVYVGTPQSSETGKVESINSSEESRSQSLSIQKSENGGVRDTLEKIEDNLEDEVESEGRVEKLEEESESLPSGMKNSKVVSKIEESGSESSSKEKVQLGYDGKCQLEPEKEVGKVISKGSGESVEEEYTQNGEESGIAGAIAQLNLESAEPSPALQEYIRRQNWETGNMDYMGKDSFDNIWAKICQTVEGKELEVLPGSQPSPSTESQKPGEGVAQPTMPKTEEKVSVLSKTPDPEYIETLPSGPPVRSTEEDEIIFSKPEKGAPLLSNIKEEEDKAVAPPVAAQTTPASPPVAVQPTLVSPPVAAQTTPASPPVAAQPTPVSPPVAAQTTPASPPVAAQPTPVSPPVAAQPTPVSPPVAAQPTPASPPVAAQTTPATPPAAPTAMPTAPQAEPKTGMTPQGTPAAETKPKEAPSTDKPQPNVETKTQQTPGNDNKVVAPPAGQIKPQEVPAPEIKAEAKAPAVAEGSPAEKAKGSEKTEQAEKVPITSSGPKPEDSAAGTPAVPQAPASKPGEEPKTTKAGPEATPKTENVQAPTIDSGKKAAEPVVAAQPMESPKNVEVPKPETKETQAGSANTENLPKDMGEGKKPTDQIKTELKPTDTPTKEDSAKQGFQTPVKEEAGAPPQERQVPPTPTITPPTPTTPTSMALMVIPKDSKTLVKLSDIMDPTKPVQEEEQQKVGPTAEPIPMPPVPEPETSEQKKTKSSPSQEPTDQPQKTTRSDSLKENGKQKKGVFSKILEIVGVTPKDKKEDEGDASKSVFYDVENAKEAISSPENVAEVKETPKEDLSKGTPQEPVSVTPEQEKVKEPEKPTQDKGKPEDSKAENKGKPEDSKTEDKGKPEDSKTEDKGKPGKNKGKQKPARNQKPGDTKGQAPLPKQPEPAKQETPVVPAPTQSAEPQQQDVAVPPSVEPVTKESVKSEIEDILGKAKSEAESRLQAVDTEVAGKAEELINTMKLLVDDGKEPPKVEQPDVEELKVTSPEERQKHKGEASKSKLSDQILKAIPPPRRKAISDAKSETPSSTGAIPKTTSEPAPKEEQKPKEQKPAEGGKGGKSSKASSIPVPPPRNKPKPPQAAPSKGKGKK